MKSQGKQAFFEFYASIFNYSVDAFTTSNLLKALQVQSKPVLGLTKHTVEKLIHVFNTEKIPINPVDWYPYAWRFPENKELGEILPGYKKHYFYPLNISSLLPILALDLQPTDTVLDACAAPGGKSVQITNFLAYPQQLITNDLSPDRSNRLKTTLADFGLSDVPVFNVPAEKLAFQFPESFDKILVDAPCSSEKHVLNSPKHLQEWSYNRIKVLQKRQIKLVNSLLKALKPGGLLVYSTCALNYQENEEVVSQVLKRSKNTLSLKPFTPPNTIGTEGLPGAWENVFDVTAVKRVLPSLNDEDPMFVAIFNKL